MNDFLVITAVGEDRPGIVDELSRIMLDNELNIEESRMSILGGEFAIILLVSGDRAQIDHISQQQQQLEQALGLKLMIKVTRARQPKQHVSPYTISVVGMDHPGIVQRLAHFLARHNINIQDMKTDSQPAAHTGSPLFTVDMRVDIPASLAIEPLREDFLALCEANNLDARFSPLNNGTER